LDGVDSRIALLLADIARYGLLVLRDVNELQFG